ncbi:MAG: Recombination factor protein RarA [Acetothermia bacterium 64_32]|nr:MAG: Recombination factor protein RarA [Acetothermia bacterium 64_32]MBC7098392.1 replication-associated recombination protein A [Candidatus Bipolaricaulota bacterium]HAF70578.1 AAA family ATPase [Candidatus Acetothermia bacterium]
MKGLWQGEGPLAERLRPHDLSEVVGQGHLLGPKGPLRALIERGGFSALIFWGPPGTGKTTLGRIIAARLGARFVWASAALVSTGEVKKALEASRELWKRTGGRDLLFLDEIHRWNRAQQDVLLPYLEEGSVLFIGATTENPSFALRPALLSRAQLFVFRPLSEEELAELLSRALSDERGYGGRVSLTPEARAFLIRYADGDARRLLTALETAVAAEGEGELTLEQLSRALGRKAPRYDRAGEEHYNLISALHKSIRNSDVDATLYWLARMLESGEDPRYLARRLIRIASEDVGLADPGALRLAAAAAQAVELVGLPECELALAQAAVYLALAPKSNALYTAYEAARRDVRETIDEPVPLHLRNPVTDTMRELGYGRGYQYAHDLPEGVAKMECLPPGLSGREYYHPKDVGWEARLRERLARLRRLIRDQNP